MYKSAETGREILQWASDDLKVYAQRCYDPQTGQLVVVNIPQLEETDEDYLFIDGKEKAALLTLAGWAA